MAITTENLEPLESTKYVETFCGLLVTIYGLIFTADNRACHLGDVNFMNLSRLLDGRKKYYCIVTYVRGK